MVVLDRYHCNYTQFYAYQEHIVVVYPVRPAKHRSQCVQYHCRVGINRVPVVRACIKLSNAEVIRSRKIASWYEASITSCSRARVVPRRRLICGELPRERISNIVLQLGEKTSMRTKILILLVRRSQTHWLHLLDFQESVNMVWLLAQTGSAYFVNQL